MDFQTAAQAYLDTNINSVIESLKKLPRADIHNYASTMASKYYDSYMLSVPSEVVDPVTRSSSTFSIVLQIIICLLFFIFYWYDLYFL